MILQHKKKVDELGIKKGDYCIYENEPYEITFACGYWVNLQPLTKVMVTTDKIKIVKKPCSTIEHA